MKYDFSRIQSDYHNNGYAVIDGIVPHHQAALWRDRLAFLFDGSTEFEKPNVEMTSKAPDGDEFFVASRSYELIRGTVVRTDPVMRTMESYYHALVPFFAAVTGLEVETGKDITTAITCKRFQSGKGFHDWHYDSNRITCLLYLTDNFNGGETEVVPLTAQRHTHIDFPPAVENTETVRCKVGRILLMRGREVWHRGRMLQEGENKMACPLNYYCKGDHWRPESLDESTRARVDEGFLGKI